MSNPLSIRPGEIAHIELPFSEVCMHMRVAGQKLPVELLASAPANPLGRVHYSAQIYDNYLEKCGAPVTLGEAGIHRIDGAHGTHFYHY